ncbi:hypothetical protein D7W09_00480 [bacterium D16-34]|nr:hypothetical protein D7W09_00480 [bacterium D16-34]
MASVRNSVVGSKRGRTAEFAWIALQEGVEDYLCSAGLYDRLRLASFPSLSTVSKWQKQHFSTGLDWMSGEQIPLFKL